MFTPRGDSEGHHEMTMASRIRVTLILPGFRPPLQLDKNSEFFYDALC